MSKVKVLMSTLFIALIVYSLAYKNILAPEDKSSLFATIADMAIPLFMFYSLILMFFKRRVENSGKKKTTSEDREFFKNIGSSDDYSKKK